jgi:hypothetical protein
LAKEFGEKTPSLHNSYSGRPEKSLGRFGACEVEREARHEQGVGDIEMMTGKVTDEKWMKGERREVRKK